MMFGFHGRSQVKINLSGDYLLDLVVLIFLISTLVKRCLNTAVVLTNLRQVTMSGCCWWLLLVVITGLLLLAYYCWLVFTFGVRW